jgi:zeta-carotene desaturase
MDVIVAGGGLAGMAAAVALGQHGFSVKLLEARGFAGGRATSYELPGVGEVDNCQHILLRCCVNLLDFYRRLGVSDGIEFHRDFYFLEPGGRLSPWRRGLLPAPAHFTEALLGAKWLSWSEKAALGRAMLAVMWERRSRRDLGDISMAEWLAEKRQPKRLVERFWRQILLSAINVELDEMAAVHGFQVIWLGFLAASDTYEMGIPRVPLAQLYGKELPGVEIAWKARVEGIDLNKNEVVAAGEAHRARALISALPSDQLAALAPHLPIEYSAFVPSSITGIHLWFDRPVTDLPHGTLLDREIQWFFNKGGGKYLMLVVSASEAMLKMGRQEIIDLALRELSEFLPKVAEAKLEKAQVVKEAKATFRARPGLEPLRPVAETAHPGFFLAGDWTRSGWPATMEGAVRSGYLAAESAAKYLGRPGRFLLPDVA